MRTYLDEILETTSPPSVHSFGCNCKCCRRGFARHPRSCTCPKCQQEIYQESPIFGAYELLQELSGNALQNAVQYNTSKAASVGWLNYFNDIVSRIFRLNYSPDAAAFAALVAQWQTANGLSTDGMLGPGTWGKMKQLLLSNPPVSGGTRVYFPSGESLAVTTGDTGTGQEHWDVLGSGNPLLDTSGANKDKFLSKNFQVKEFSKSADKARIDVKLVECLQKLRDALGRSITVTSGYRSYGYNKRLYESKGKTPTKSQHISGRAVDIKVSGLNGLQLAKEAIKVCGCDIAIGLGWSFIHLDVRGKYTPGYTFTVWDYGNGGLDHWISELRQFHRLICSGR